PHVLVSDQVQLGGGTAARTPDPLAGDRLPLLVGDSRLVARAAGAAVRLHAGSVQGERVPVDARRLLPLQHRQDLLPHARALPPAEAVVDRLPGAVTLRDAPP